MLIALWNDFFTRFTDRLNAVNPADLLAVWDKEEARTQIYTQVLRDVSEGMGLTFRREHSRIDYMLGNAHLAVDRTALAFVPSIAIESENQAMGAHEEVNFLHAVTAPVKVLITCALWTRSGSRQWSPERLLEHWRAIRQVHCAAAPARPDDVFGIIVGEKALDGRSVRFFLHMLSDLPAPHRANRSRRLRAGLRDAKQVWHPPGRALLWSGQRFPKLSGAPVCATTRPDSNPFFPKLPLRFEHDLCHLLGDKLAS